ncbi:MAG TPA: PAS domain S-box protein [Bacteroidota bacterium]|nr:PAS domain S-box protein [Bacteroidota bacterium]
MNRKHIKRDAEAVANKTIARGGDTHSLIDTLQDPFRGYKAAERGTTLIAPPVGSKPGNTENLSAAGNSSESELRILFLEDSPNDALLIERELQNSGIFFHSVCVDNRKAFLEQLDSFIPDAILSDFTLPQFTALDALSLLKEHSLDVPFIVITGSQSDEVAVECLKAGADDYLLKTSLRRLPMVLLSSLAKKDAEKEKERIHQALESEIVERRRAEHTLAKNERRFRALIEHSSDAIALITEEGMVRYCSASIERMLGYAPEELLGQNCFSIVHPADRHHVTEAVSGILKSPEHPVTYQARLMERSGKPIWTENTLTNLLTDESVGAIVINFRDITERKDNEERLEHLSRRLIEIQETERRHIACELHDEIGQALSAVKINLQAVQRGLDTETVAARLRENVEIVDTALTQVRNLSLDLRPSILDDLGIVAALRWYLDRVAQRSGFQAQFTSRGIETRLPSGLETTCFRITQEALTNIVRHSHARNVEVEFWKTGMNVHLIIRDDGVGFAPEEAKKNAARGSSLGILGMYERAALAGGIIKFNSHPNQGTEIIAHFPCPII